MSTLLSKSTLIPDEPDVSANVKESSPWRSRRPVIPGKPGLGSNRTRLRSALHRSAPLRSALKILAPLRSALDRSASVPSLPLLFRHSKCSRRMASNSPRVSSRPSACLPTQGFSGFSGSWARVEAQISNARASTRSTVLNLIVFMYLSLVPDFKLILCRWFSHRGQKIVLGLSIPGSMPRRSLLFRPIIFSEPGQHKFPPNVQSLSSSQIIGLTRNNF
jgi:hypothetical protein